MSVTRKIANVAMLVDSYDDAIKFYCEKVGFDLLEDTNLGGGKRWVRIAPATDSSLHGTSILLAEAKGEQKEGIGAQGAGRVWLFLETSDFWKDYERMKAAGVEFCEEPRKEVYATVVVFQDLYGNKWDLLQPNTAKPGNA